MKTEQPSFSLRKKRFDEKKLDIGFYDPFELELMRKQLGLDKHDWHCSEWKELQNILDTCRARKKSIILITPKGMLE